MEGRKHSLTIKKAVKDDGGDYRVVIDEAQSEGKLKVTGNLSAISFPSGLREGITSGEMLRLSRIYRCFPEAGAEFLKPLTDQTIMEYDTASFECQLSKPKIKVTWKKDGVALKGSVNVDMKSKEQRHYLVMRNCSPDDSSMISVCAENVESAAQLTVNGTGVQCRLFTCAYDSIVCIVIVTNIDTYFVCLLEIPIKFLRELDDREVLEQDCVTLECEVNKCDQHATWYQANTEVKSDNER